MSQSKHRAPRPARRRARRRLQPAGFVRRAQAGAACAVVTVGAIAVGVVTTAPARPDVVAAEQPVAHDTAVRPTDRPAEVPVEVRPVAGFDEPATLDDTPVADGAAAQVVGPVEEQSVEEIPDEAAAAYQRAESVIADARPTCRLSWTVLAAVGHVESDHGRADGGELGADGTVEPARFGATLNGQRGRQKVRDTDAGALDGERRWDRTVGPLNFLPATWNVVGVDADDDGRRDPQDLDDAALAAAVVLCGKDAELATPAGLAEALGTLNPAGGYARTVSDVAQAYDAELEEIAAAEPEVVELPAPEADLPVARHARERDRDRDPSPEPSSSPTPNPSWQPAG